jgi:antitoxin component of MazEF toxin-antitoxin module
MKKLYALQPYMVGSKKGKSLVVVIPSEVVKMCNIDTSTVFTLNGDEKTKTVTLQTVQRLNENITAISAGQSLEASSQQISGV